MSRIGLVLLLASSTGCALVLNRGQTTQALRIETDPPGAVAETPEGQRCETPCELRVRRSGDAIVTVAKDGLEPDAVRFRSRLGEVTLLNLILSVPGLALGLPIDLLTGAAYDLVPSGARLELRPRDEGAPAQAPPAPRELAPRRPGRLALTLQLGAGTTEMDGAAGILHFGLQGTWRVTGPLLVGAAYDGGAEFVLWGGGGTTSSVLALAGVEGRPTRNSRAVALLQTGRHRYDGYPERHDFPAIGARAEWTAVFGDALLLGAYGGYLRDLGRAAAPGPYGAGPTGGDTVLLGVTLGWLSL